MISAREMKWIPDVLNLTEICLEYFAISAYVVPKQSHLFERNEKMASEQYREPNCSTKEKTNYCKLLHRILLSFLLINKNVFFVTETSLLTGRITDSFHFGFPSLYCRIVNC